MFPISTKNLSNIETGKKDENGLNPGCAPMNEIFFKLGFHILFGHLFVRFSWLKTSKYIITFHNKYRSFQNIEHLFHRREVHANIKLKEKNK